MKKHWITWLMALNVFMMLPVLSGCFEGLNPLPDTTDDAGAEIPEEFLSGILRGVTLTLQFDEDGVGKAIVLDRDEILRLAERLGLYEPPPTAKTLVAQQAIDFVSLPVGVEVELGTGNLSLLLVELTYDPVSNTITIVLQIILRDDDGVEIDRSEIQIVLSGITQDDGGNLSVDSMVITGTDNNGNQVFEEALGGQDLSSTGDNLPPVATAAAIPAVVEGNVLVLLTAVGSADPDGDILTYSWVQTGGEPSVSLTGADLDTSGFVSPDVQAGTILTFTVTISDGSASSSASVEVRVLKTNHPPVAEAGEDQTVDPGTNVKLDGSGSSDPDGDNLTFSWQVLNDPSPVTLKDADKAKASFTAPNPIEETTIIEIELTVSDGGLSSIDVVRVVVEPGSGQGVGGGGQGPPSIFSLVPQDVTYLLALRSFADLADGVDNFTGTPDVIANLLAQADLEFLADFDASIAVFSRESDGLVAVLLELNMGQFINGLDFIIPDNIDFTVKDVGQGIKRIQFTGTPVEFYVSSSVRGKHIVIAGTKNYAWTISNVMHQHSVLLNFNESWLNAYNDGHLLIYSDGSALPLLPSFSGFLPSAPNRPFSLLGNVLDSSAQPLQTAFSLNALPTVSSKLPDTEAICLLVDVNNPFRISYWQRYVGGSPSAIKLAAMPMSTDGSLLVGLPNEPFVYAWGGLPIQSDLLSTLFSGFGSNVLGSLQGQTNMSLSELAGGEGGLVGLAHALTLNHTSAQVDAADAYLAMVAGFVSDLRNYLASQNAEDLVTYNDNTGEYIRGRKVNHLRIDVDLLVDLLGPNGITKEGFAVIFGNEFLLFRIVKVDSNHVCIGVGGGANRTKTIIDLMVAGETPLESRLADVTEHFVDRRLVEVFVKPGQVPKLLYDIAQAMGANLPPEDDPGEGNSDFAFMMGRENNSVCFSGYVTVDVLKLLAEFYY
ncbi:MAG: PKD domain-containing protein [Planctomycetota bacterium]|jgi:hypothetical protein